MRADRQCRLWPGVMLLLALLSSAVARADNEAPPEPELLEFLALFADADEEALDLALASVQDEEDAESRQSRQGDSARGNKDETH